MSNSFKAWVFLFCSTLFILVLGYELGERLGLFISFLLALSINSLIFFYGDTHLIHQMGGIKTEGQDSWGINQLVQKYADTVGIPHPSIYVCPIASPMAFALGRNWQRSAITVSVGLIEKLKPTELEAVVAHQIAQIKNLDTFAFGVSSTVANSLIGLGQILDLLWLPRYFSKKMNIRPFSNMMTPFAWLIIRLSVSQSTYFTNDTYAASLLKDSQILAETLWKLESLASTQPLKVPACTEHLFVVNPTHNSRQVLTHPSVELRIRKLIGYYPI